MEDPEEEIEEQEEEEVFYEDDVQEAGGQSAIRFVIWFLIMLVGAVPLLFQFFMLDVRFNGLLPVSVGGPWVIFAITLVFFLYVSGTLSSAVYVLPAWQRIVLLRFGKFNGVHGPGIIFVTPYITAVARVLDMRVFTKGFAAEQALTKDSVPVTVDAVYFARLDKGSPEQAVLGVEDFRLGTHHLAQAALRSAIGSHTLQQLLTDRTSVATEIQSAISTKAAEFGVVVDSVQIKDIKPPVELQLVLAKNAAAVRDAEAQTTIALAQQDIAELLAKAAAIYANNPTALILKQLTILQEMAGRAGQTIIVPTDVLGALTAVVAKKS